MVNRLLRSNDIVMTSRHDHGMSDGVSSLQRSVQALIAEISCRLTGLQMHLHRGHSHSIDSYILS